MGGNAQPHGRHRHAVEVNEQRLPSYHAIDVGSLVEVRDSHGGRTDGSKRLLRAQRRQSEADRVADGVALRKGGQGRVWATLGFAQTEQRRDNDIARARHAFGQARIGVQTPLGVGDERLQLAARHVAQLTNGRHRGRRAVDTGLQRSQLRQAAVGLWLEKERSVGNGFGTCG